MISGSKDYNREELRQAFESVRKFSIELCEPLEIEDYVVQSMPDVSPARWHLAHVTWFFEVFVLAEAHKDYKYFNEVYNYLFNSYYVQAGDRFYRPHRGLLTRPTVKEVLEYRTEIDKRMLDFLIQLMKNYSIGLLSLLI